MRYNKKMQPKIALATAQFYPDLDEDDRLLIPAFRSAGALALPIIWDDPQVDWTAFESIILRSVWDYHEKLGAFRAWLEHLRSRDAVVWNPVNLVQENVHKSYLRNLERSGIQIVPTLWVDDAFDLANEIRALKWGQVVLKPAVSAGSRDTFRFAGSNAAQFQSVFDSMRQRGTVMLQPFLTEVVSEGEWSFIFFARELSHVVLKTPANGDFRVQESYGGSYTAQTQPPPSALLQARAVLDRVTGPLLYARVDLVRHRGCWLLAELEITEPSLYLAKDAAAAERFVGAYFNLMRG